MRLIDAETLVGDLITLYNAKRDEWCDKRAFFTDRLLKTDPEAAIKSEKLQAEFSVITDVMEAIQNAKVIKAPVEPGRKTGRWIVKDNPVTGWYRVTCSECGEDVTSVVPMIGFFPNGKVLWDYCPECGAKMEEEDGDENG